MCVCVDDLRAEPGGGRGVGGCDLLSNDIKLGVGVLVSEARTCVTYNKLHQ